MHFNGGIRRKIVDVVMRVESHVMGANHNIAYVQQKPAAGMLNEFAEKLRLFHRGRVKTHITRWVFDQIWNAQGVLYFIDVRRNDL